MADVRMKTYDSVYNNSSVTHWANGEEYRRAEQFLSSIGASRTPPDDAVDKNADFYLKDMSQIHAFGRYYHNVIENRPRIGPPRLDMFIYVEYAGGHGYIDWASEDEYQQARKFLIEIGVESVHIQAARYTNPEHFSFATREQYQAFLKYQKSVEKKRET